ncbi:MAG: hypothetical protein ABJB03_13285 [Rhodoglobus sp.]
MKGRIAVFVMAALLVIYLVFVTQYAIRLILDPNGIAKAIGFALIVLPLVGAYVLVAELTFAFRAEALAKKLGTEGGLPVDDLPKLPSGRADPVAADAQFPAYQAAVEANPESWQDWFRLGLAYDASGDRRRARWAAREAIRLERGTR